MLLAGSALAAPSWLQPKNLSDPGFSAFRPEVGVDSSGEVVASWFGAASGGELAQSSARSRGGIWSPAATLSEEGAINPDLAVSSSGTAVMVWEFDSISDGSYIEAAIRHGGAWSDSTILPIGNLLYGAYYPRVAVDAAGDALAVWQQCYLNDNLKCFEGKGEYEVRAAVRPANGTWSQPMTVSSASENAKKLSAAIDSAGDLAVAWEDMKGGQAHVALRRAGDSGWTSQALAANPSGSPQVAFAEDGTATAVWDENDGGFWVASATAAPGSASWSAAQHLSGTGFNAFQPDLAVAPNGAAVAVWETLSGGNPVQAAVRSGGAWQPAQSISAEGVAAELPRVAINAAGAAVAVWQAAGGSGKFVQANVRPSGGAWGGVRDVSAPAAGAAEPAAAIDGEGNAVAVWRAGAVMQAAGFDAAAPRIEGLSIPATGVVGQSLDFSAAPSDAWSGAASTSWSFGDGSGAGGTRVAHTFGRPGTYQVTVTSTDAVGNVSTATGTIVVSPASGGSGSGAATVGGSTPAPTSKPPRRTAAKGIARIVGAASIRNGKAVLALACGGAGPCAGVVKLVLQRTSVIGKSAFHLPVHGSRTLRVALGPAALQLLSESPGERLSVRVEGRGVRPRGLVLGL